MANMSIDDSDSDNETTDKTAKKDKTSTIQESETSTRIWLIELSL